LNVAGRERLTQDLVESWGKVLQGADDGKRWAIAIETPSDSEQHGAAEGFEGDLTSKEIGGQ